MLRTVIIVAASVILLFSADDAARVTEPRDYGWMPLKSACYYISLEKMNWSTADISCQEMDASDSVKMTEKVLKQMTWWVAFEMNSSDETLVSAPVNSSFSGHISLWKPQYPSNKKQYDCGLMDAEGFLVDAKCTFSKFFICEKHLNNPTKMKDCESGWILIASSCYKLSTVRSNWFGALKICNAYDADLMSVDSLQELLQIREELGRAGRVTGWWVGLQKVPWQWLEDPSPYRLFIPWETPEPTHDGECVELTLKGLLNDVSCDRSNPYICEKSLNNSTDKDNGRTGSIIMSSCYTVSRDKANYRQAQENCLADGANLLSISSSKELLEVRKEVKRIERESHWWVGLRKNTSSNTWKWLEAPPSLTPLVLLWDVDQPDDWGQREDCAEMFVSGNMNDMPCDWSSAYICEKQPNNSKDSTNCETGWSLISSSCYKLFVEERTWSEAQRNCNANGANLLSINSLDELLHIKKEMERFPVISRWWIGLQKSESSGNWEWLEQSQSSPKTPLVAMWDTDEPREENRSDCAVLGPDGFLSSVSCERTRRYICKKQSGSNCGAGWISINGSCYKLSTDAVTWMDALANCTVDGSNLFTVSSLEELIKKNITERHDLSPVWVGMQKTSEDRRWRWQGVSSSFSPLVKQWKEDESNKVLSKGGCVVMDSDGLLDGAPCDSLRHVLCVKPSEKTRAGTDDCETGWFLISQNCYKFFPMMMRFKAQKTCEAEGSNLMSVNTFHELMEILKRIRRENSRWWVYLKIEDPGTSASSARGIRETGDATETCGEITPDGLNYTDCLLVCPYICQKNQNDYLVKKKD